MQVLYDLRFDGFGVGQFDDANRDGIEFRDSGGPETACSGHDLILASLQFPDQERRKDSLRFETGCLLCRWSFCGRERPVAREKGVLVSEGHIT